jgi:hypothetical protein
MAARPDDCKATARARPGFNQSANSDQTNPNKTKQSCLDFLGFIRPIRDFSMGYKRKIKKSTRVSGCVQNVSPRRFRANQLNRIPSPCSSTGADLFGEYGNSSTHFWFVQEIVLRRVWVRSHSRRVNPLRR